VSKDDELFDFDFYDVKGFQTRFRVTWSLYAKVLLPWTEENFKQKPDAVGNMGMPVALKLLGVLRILGRALHFDDIAQGVKDCFFVVDDKYCRHNLVEFETNGNITETEPEFKMILHFLNFRHKKSLLCKEAT
jgi:hypothetical protein